jgi:hypothetical protein
MYLSIVDRDKPIVLKEIETLIEEPVRSVMDELDEMGDIIVVQKSWAAHMVLSPHDVAGGAPHMKEHERMYCAGTQHMQEFV